MSIDADVQMGAEYWQNVSAKQSVEVYDGCVELGSHAVTDGNTFG